MARNRKTLIPDAATKRAYLSQSDVPARSLDQALRIAQALAENYGKNPTRPLRVAQALNVQPSTSGFRMLCGASIAYGLTEGGYNSAQIALTPLGRRIVAPTSEGDDQAARREALLRPRVIRDFLGRYNGSKLPTEHIARNVLEELGVPQDRTADVFNLVVEGARTVGFLQEVKGSLYVDLDSATPASDAAGAQPTPLHEPVGSLTVDPDEPAVPPAGSSSSPRRVTRVFITHGKNHEIAGQLKDLLTFGGFTPVIAIEQESTSKPLPDKVMDEMRSCHAAIIHVGTEAKLLDENGKEHRVLNQNVLIEIGAALALYGRKFILLVERGVTMPSNVTGLYEVRYEGAKLDYDATMKLLKSFNDFRS